MAKAVHTDSKQKPSPNSTHGKMEGPVMNNEQRIKDLKAMLPRNSALIDLADGVDAALALIASGRVEAARSRLENALRYASATTETGQQRIMLTNVRSGGGFK